jgi:hypothetical protein
MRHQVVDSYTHLARSLSFQQFQMAARRRAEQRRYRERLRARKDAEIAGLGQSALRSPTIGATP